MGIILVDNCNTTSGWGNSVVTSGDQNGVSTNTSIKQEGTGSLNCNYDVSLHEVNRAAWARTSGAVNLSGPAEQTGYIRFWLYIPDVTHFNVFHFQFGSDLSGGNNRYYKQSNNKDAYGNNLHNGWNEISIPWSAFTKQGSPNRSNLIYWFIQIEYDAPQGDSRVQLDWIRHDTETVVLSDIKKFLGVAQANLKKILGVASGDAKKILGVTN